MNGEQILDKKSILTQIEAHLINKFVRFDYISKEEIPIVTFESKGTEKLATWLKSKGFVLESIIGSDLGKKVELIYQFGYRLNSSNGTFLFRSIVQKTQVQESISAIFLSAHFWQNMISKRLGINFYSIHNTTVQEQKASSYYPISLNLPEFSHSKSKRSIFHPIHKDGFYLQNKMKKGAHHNGFKLHPGWLYSNVNSRFESSSIAHNISNPISPLFPEFLPELDLIYCLLLEQIFPIELNLKIKYVRMFLAEINRIMSHLYWFADLATLLQLFPARKKFLEKINLLVKILEQKLEYNPFSTRISYGMAPDIKSEAAGNFYSIIKKINADLMNFLHRFIKRRTVRVNLIDLGHISKKDALESGLTGPNLRASGLNVDLREKLEYFSYVSGPLSQNWSVIMGKNGDSYSRAVVRMYEIQESLNLCEEISLGLSQYQRSIKPITIPPDVSIGENQMYLGGIESPRGSLFMLLKTASQKNYTLPHTVRILTPDQRNFAALNNPNLFNGENLRDMPLLLHSLDIQYPLVDF